MINGLRELVDRIVNLPGVGAAESGLDGEGSYWIRFSAGGHAALILERGIKGLCVKKQHLRLDLGYSGLVLIGNIAPEKLSRKLPPVGARLLSMATRTTETQATTL